MKKCLLVKIVLCLMCLPLLFSCSSDDESTSGDFIQVSFDGKTYTQGMNTGLNSQIPMGTELAMSSVIEDVFYHDGFQFYFSLIHFEKRSQLLKSTPGSYRVCPDFQNEDLCRNLDFSADFEYNDGSEYFWSEKGSHQVTRISENEVGVQIEGTFSLDMESDEGSVKKISGSYRMTVDTY